MPKKLQDGIGLSLLALLLVVCFAPVVLSRASLLTSPFLPGALPDGPYGYDGRRVRSSLAIDAGASAWQGEPWVKLASKQVRAGQVPLWNPYNGFGAPLAANMQSGVFSPLHWILFFSSDPWTWNVFLLLRLYMAGAFTYLYLRLFRLSIVAALAGAITLMLSGYFVLYVNMMHLNVEVLLPLVVYLTEHLIRVRSVGAMLLLAGALAVTVLGGMPESTLFLWSFATLYYVVRTGVLGWRRGRGVATGLRLLPLLAGAVGIALGLSAVLLVPFIEYLRHSWTSHSGLFGLSGNSPSTAISVLLPYFFKHLSQSWAPGVNNHAVLPYLGMMPLLLALFAWPARGRLRGIVLFCAGYAIVGLLKAYTVPGINWIGSLPVFDHAIFYKYNQPEVTFAVAILAGIGVHHLQQAGWKVGVTRIVVLWVLVTCAIVASLSLWWPTITGAGAIRWVRSQTRFGILTLLVDSGLVGALRAIKERWRPLLVGTMVVVLAVEMYVYIPKDRPSKYEAATTPPYVEFLRTHCPPGECRVYGLDSVLFPNWSAVFQLADIRVLDGMYVDRLLKFSNVLLGNSDHDRFTGGTSREFKPNFFLGFSNVRYLLTSGEIAATDLIDDVLVNSQWQAERPFVSKTRFVIDGVGKTVLFEHPPAEIAYPLEVPKHGAILRFSLGMEPAVWSPSKGDGMEFEVEVVDRGEKTSLFKRYYDPKHQDTDRRWIDGEVDLFPFRGRRVQLRLITRPGEGNAFDQGGWGDLRLVSADSFQPTIVYDGEVKIYENRAVAPRAFVVHRAEVIRGEEAIVERLQSPDFDPRRMAILEEDVTAEQLQWLGAEPNPGPVARIWRYLPDRVEMTVETDRPGMLVLLDAYFPGWQAHVNGKPTRVYRTNYLFRGVFVEVGKNEVRFDYSPWSFWAGLGVSGGTLIAVGAAVALSRLPPRRHSKSP